MLGIPFPYEEEPTCLTRDCKHFLGVGGARTTWSSYWGNDIMIDLYVCKAFPDGIPDKITYGDNLHLEPLKGQGNDIVYTHN